MCIHCLNHYHPRHVFLITTEVHDMWLKHNRVLSSFTLYLACYCVQIRSPIHMASPLVIITAYLTLYLRICSYVHPFIHTHVNVHSSVHTNIYKVIQLHSPPRIYCSTIMMSSVLLSISSHPMPSRSCLLYAIHIAIKSTVLHTLHGNINSP